MTRQHVVACSRSSSGSRPADERAAAAAVRPRSRARRLVLGELAWRAAAEAGYPAYAVSLRGHGGSAGRLRTALLRPLRGRRRRDGCGAARGRPVLVGHSMGGLVVQQALARYAARAAVLVAPVPAHPAVASLAAIARRHPLDALRIVGGGSLPLRPDYLFHELADAAGAARTPTGAAGSRRSCSTSC